MRRDYSPIFTIGKIQIICIVRYYYIPMILMNPFAGQDSSPHFYKTVSTGQGERLF